MNFVHLLYGWARQNQYCLPGNALKANALISIASVVQPHNLGNSLLACSSSSNVGCMHMRTADPLILSNVKLVHRFYARVGVHATGQGCLWPFHYILLTMQHYWQLHSPILLLRYIYSMHAGPATETVILTMLTAPWSLRDQGSVPSLCTWLWRVSYFSSLHCLLR